MPATPTSEERNLELKKVDSNPTPDNPSTSGNEEVQTDLVSVATRVKWGVEGWCAALSKCTNHDTPSTGSTAHICHECKICAHAECPTSISAEAASSKALPICLHCYEESYQTVEDSNLSMIESVDNNHSIVMDGNNTLDSSVHTNDDVEGNDAHMWLGYHLTVRQKEDLIDLIHTKK